MQQVVCYSLQDHNFSVLFFDVKNKRKLPVHISFNILFFFYFLRNRKNIKLHMYTTRQFLNTGS